MKIDASGLIAHPVEIMKPQRDRRVTDIVRYAREADRERLGDIEWCFQVWGSESWHSSGCLLVKENFWAEEAVSSALYHTSPSGAESSTVHAHGLEYVLYKQFLQPPTSSSLSSTSNVLNSHVPREATFFTYKGVNLKGDIHSREPNLLKFNSCLPSEQSFI